MSEHKTHPSYFFEQRRSSILNPGRRAERHCVHFPFELKYGSDIVGMGHADVLRFGRGERRGHSAQEIISCLGEHVDDVYPAIFAPNTGRLRADLVKPTELRDVLFIECIKLIPSQRGRSVGLWLVEWLIDLLGAGCAAAVLAARPANAFDENAPESKDNNAFFTEVIDDVVYSQPFSATGEAAKTKLRAHFAEMGFKRAGDSDYMVCDISELP